MSAKLVFAAPKSSDGVTIDIPIRFKASAVAQPSRTIAATAPSDDDKISVPGDDDDDTISVPTKPVRPVAPSPKPVPQAPAPQQPIARPTAPPPADPPRPPAPIPQAGVPQCDPRNPRAFSNDWKEIDKSMADIAGYKHAFNPNWFLHMEGDPDCHLTIDKKVDNHGTIFPYITLEGNSCDAPFSKPAKACVAGDGIRFLIDNTQATGRIPYVGPQPVVEFKQQDAHRWTVFNQQLGTKVLQEAKTATVAH